MSNTSEEYRQYRRDLYAKDPVSAQKKKKDWRLRNQEKNLHITAKARAKRLGVPFSIEFDDIVIPELCPLLEIPLDRSTPHNVPSLDRVVPELGYVKGNVRVISHLANMMKSSATPEQLRTFARNITDYC